MLIIVKMAKTSFFINLNVITAIKIPSLLPLAFWCILLSSRKVELWSFHWKLFRWELFNVGVTLENYWSVGSAALREKWKRCLPRARKSGYISIMVCYITCCSANYGTIIIQLTTIEAVCALLQVLCTHLLFIFIVFGCFPPTVD